VRDARLQPRRTLRDPRAAARWPWRHDRGTGLRGPAGCAALAHFRLRARPARLAGGGRLRAPMVSLRSSAWLRHGLAWAMMFCVLAVEATGSAVEATAAAVEVVDDSGRTVRLVQPARRIV